MIEINGLGKTYGRRPGVIALRDVSLVIEAGRVTAVIGPNGAGKSTLFGLILGFLKPSSGDVSIAGHHPRDYMHENGIGYVSERFALPPGWPVRRAVDALSKLAGVDSARADAAMESFGLSGHLDKPVRSLSRGLLQRLGLANAFAPGRDLLVLDEPSEGLDPIWRIRLRDRINAERDAGRTILLASHDLAEVERIADTVIVLERGAVNDVLHPRRDAAGAAYRIQLADACPRMAEVFPDATSVGTHRFVVAVNDTDDLNTRLAGLIEVGGRVVDVRVDDEPLETRVQRTMQS